MAQTILIVDDDPHIRDVIYFSLEKANMKTAQAGDGAAALKQFESLNPDLIILDISMPEMDGIEVCRTIRKTSDVPILFLSSRDEEIDRILGLEIGGDDYVTKPFSPRELVARVKVILKRVKPVESITDENVKILSHGGVTLEVENHTVSFQETDLQLTATEFSILKGLLKHPKRVYNRDMIMDMAYAHNIHVSDRTIDSHIRHIRSKFEKLGCEQVIETVHGVGYKLGTCL